ncbi:acetyltransferase [uncultured Celeribacter sp.]|uniref:acetyltransferase n=1 Tax=uncultured Celeribacter sp. TaxID=1303376 RepID=UPI002AA93AC7|nr:acetyltransferase [uncultured Celeribacter sp.]
MLTSTMLTFRPSSDQDLSRVMEIWRRAVDATHHFLAPVDKSAIEAELMEFFPKVSLQLAVDAAGTPQGFMFLHDGHLEALFIDPDQHGKGIGKALISRAIAAHPELTTDVNEQNPEALAFYEHVGFVRTGTSSHDGQGRPYPLIHLRHQSPM